MASTTAVGIQLHSRAAQSIAVCTQDFSWMDNSKNTSPCQVLASVDALCNNGNWIVPALNASVKYTPPSASAGTATFCTCSWASYNLISACIACQGFPEQISQWSPYSVDCGGKLSNTAFPTNLTLPNDVLIPYWAGEDPTKWPGETFNVANAKQIAAEGHPDITNSSNASKKSTNIGAIIGGVVGGVVVICLAIGLAYYMLRQRQSTESNKLPSNLEKSNHMRTLSDMTNGSNVNSLGYATLTSSQVQDTNVPTSPTILTHSSSIRSIPFMSSIAGSIATRTQRSLGRQPSAGPPPSSQEDVIAPYTLPPVSNNPDRKQGSGGYPVIAEPSNPPATVMRVDTTRSVAPTQRARFNPPTYAESSVDAGSSLDHGNHRANQSTDTDYSLPAGSVSRNLSTSSAATTHVTAFVNSSPPTAMRPGHGRQVSTSGRDEKRQRPPPPTEASFNASDIA
ncbi:hypothetical protein M413DRAFT_448139 [Hebeloma cylindrosporum]|uniref:Transmembrane protein n=1 Tax=Hebeloma cylindrosporum TaxID=76867 RepID=A0A0C2YA10_HEBCY|nr:hypothetical protein M413DRAFT_448139 [Hebeloma cylindrosporum h7]